jgi:hypothetical protein
MEDINTGKVHGSGVRPGSTNDCNTKIPSQYCFMVTDS